MPDLVEWAAEVARLADESIRLMSRNRELQYRIDAVRAVCDDAAESDLPQAVRVLARHIRALLDGEGDDQ